MRTGWRAGRAGTATPLLLGAFVSGAVLLFARNAFAHAADRGFVMLLPTGYYLAGGAAAVAVSFVIVAFVPAKTLDWLARLRWRFLRLPFDGRQLASLVSFVVLGLLIYSGLAGSRDPLSNPLPLVFWTVWWVGFALVIALFGDLWSWLEPWRGPYRVALLSIGRAVDAPPPLVLPARVGYVPAIGLFFAFAWFELVYPSPDDPHRLALVLAGYWIFSFAGMLLFGHGAWIARVEIFSVLFSMIARLSPLERSAGGGLSLRIPGAGAVEAKPLPITGALFLLLALSTVSYDGLMRTFFWLGLLGVNPLEFPGRSALMLENTLGLLGAFAVLAGLFLACTWLGQRLAGGGTGLKLTAGSLVWSMLPISLAYHFSHYLVSLVLNGQYALAAISDPLSRGWNLFGTAGYHVVAGATTGADSAWTIWNLQAVAIVGGHMLAVAVAHVVAFRLHGDARRASLAGLPLALLMVGYTVLGLWLLSSPTGF